MIFFTVVGMLTCAAIAAAVGYFLFLMLREHVYAWWMIVRARAIQKRHGTLQPTKLKEWVSSIFALVWKHGGEIEVGGIIVPRSPFSPIRKRRW
jgi:hypothetical protein